MVKSYSRCNVNLDDVYIYREREYIYREREKREIDKELGSI